MEYLKEKEIIELTIKLLGVDQYNYEYYICNAVYKAALELNYTHKSKFDSYPVCRNNYFKKELPELMESIIKKGNEFSSTFEWGKAWVNVTDGGRVKFMEIKIKFLKDYLKGLKK